MIHFVKPFVRFKEGERMRPAIVAYGKFPQMFRSEPGKPRDAIVYEHILYINLWLIEIILRWHTEKEAGTYKRYQGTLRELCRMNGVDNSPLDP